MYLNNPTYIWCISLLERNFPAFSYKYFVCRIFCNRYSWNRRLHITNQISYLAPVIGWGRYHKFEYGCCIAFHDKSFNVRSYVVTSLFAVLFLPFGEFWCSSASGLYLLVCKVSALLAMDWLLIKHIKVRWEWQRQESLLLSTRWVWRYNSKQRK